ncbi:diguanylate cyclase [Atopomonas hussainii]|uniref:diguanylate cyclase n=1 Tax=Atopomonas hussainii TaxID=1429083 RepID=UPI0009F5BE9C|nr:diguanylate cyclase [Atopomonas hussainii]
MKAINHWLRSALAVLSLISAPYGFGAVELTEPSYDYLGQELSYFFEPEGPPLSLSEAMAARHSGQFQSHHSRVLHLGSAPKPHWVYLPLHNADDKALRRTLEIGPAWIDQMNVYLLHGQQVLQAFYAGDAKPRQQRPVPNQGYLFVLDVPPGNSGLYVRFENIGSHPLVVRLLEETQQRTVAKWISFIDGAQLGYLLALIAFNLMLYSGLRDPNTLNYSVFLFIYVLLYLLSSSYINEWFWPDSNHFGILMLLVAVAWSSLHFARHFLDIPALYPRLNSLLKWGANAFMALSVLLSLSGFYVAGMRLTFIALIIYPVVMVVLGGLCLSRGLLAARYFLAASAFGLLGTATTNLALWNVLPFNTLTFNAMKIGVLLEATLLALALAYQMRQHQVARLQAEHMARTDPLTGLFNRRAFFDVSDSLWSTAMRNHRPLSVILLDIDHFKQINDQHGHATGDLVLIALSKLLQQTARHGDICVRWGGEEFLLLLPETHDVQAAHLAERLREQVERLKPAGLSITVSLGVAERGNHYSLDSLINDADQRLYSAKDAGRNQVCHQACVTCSDELGQAL